MLSGEHIFQVLAQYLYVLSQYLTSIVTILASIEQVNTPLVLSFKTLDFFITIFQPRFTLVLFHIAWQRACSLFRGKISSIENYSDYQTSKVCQLYSIDSSFAPRKFPFSKLDQPPTWKWFPKVNWLCLPARRRCDPIIWLIIWVSK